MATIKEDYVSYEVAKLLNEKGFQVDTDKDYWKIGEDGTKYFMCSIGAYTSDPNNKYAFYRPASSYPCPTQSVAMKWLREVHELYIEVSLSCDREDKNAKIFDASIFNLQNQRYKKLGNIQGYEQACEESIKYCLENLI